MSTFNKYLSEKMKKKKKSTWEEVDEDNGDKLTPAQKRKREEIVLSMKDKEDDFKERYGDRYKEVMYATATKMAKEGFASDAQRRAAFASGYKAKGKKKKMKKEEAPATSTAGVSGLTPETVGVSKSAMKKHKKKVKDQMKEEIKKDYPSFMEGLDRSIRSYNSGPEKIMMKEKDGHPVFVVSKEEFEKCSSKKRRKYERWDKFFGKDSHVGKKIKEYSLKNPNKPVLLQCSVTGDVVYLRRRLNDQRLVHNRRAKNA